MGCNRDRRSEKTRGMFHYPTKRPSVIPFDGKQRPSRSRLSHKQDMERPHSESKQHQSQSSSNILCTTKHYKLVQVDAPTISYSEDDINSFYNDVDENLGKTPLSDTDGRLQCANREKNKPHGNGNGQIWARIEKRKRRHLGRMSNDKKIQNH